MNLSIGLALNRVGSLLGLEINESDNRQDRLKYYSGLACQLAMATSGWLIFHRFKPKNSSILALPGSPLKSSNLQDLKVAVNSLGYRTDDWRNFFKDVIGLEPMNPATGLALGLGVGEIFLKRADGSDDQKPKGLIKSFNTFFDSTIKWVFSVEFIAALSERIGRSLGLPLGLIAGIGAGELLNKIANFVEGFITAKLPAKTQDQDCKWTLERSLSEAIATWSKFSVSFVLFIPKKMWLISRSFRGSLKQAGNAGIRHLNSTIARIFQVKLAPVQEQLSPIENVASTVLAIQKRRSELLIPKSNSLPKFVLYALEKYLHLQQLGLKYFVGSPRWAQAVGKYGAAKIPSKVLFKAITTDVISKIGLKLLLSFIAVPQLVLADYFSHLFRKEDPAHPKKK